MRTAFRTCTRMSAGILLLSGCESSFDPAGQPVVAPETTVILSHTDTWPGVFDPFTVLSLNLEISPNDWDTIRKDVTNTIEVPGQFYADGETPIAVTVRRKSSRALPSESNPIKIGMKVKTATGRWHGVTTLSLENGADIGPVAEGVAWNLHEMASVDGYYGAGYHAGLASWVKVYLNGVYLGVYVNVEQRNKQFLRNRFGTSNDMWFYEIDEVGLWELESGDPHSPTFTALCFSPFQLVVKRGGGTGTCPQPSDAQLEILLNQYIDMRAMLVQGAVDAITNNRDALFSHGKNVSFVDFADPSRRRVYYPWDLDAAFRTIDNNIYATSSGKNKYTQSPYQSVILNHPAFRQQYNQLMLGLIGSGGPLSIENINAFLVSAEPAVQAVLDTDPYVGSFRSGQFEFLKDYLTRRISIIQAQVAANVPAPRN